MIIMDLKNYSSFIFLCLDYSLCNEIPQANKGSIADVNINSWIKIVT